MSIESLLLVAFLIVIPLLERVVRILRSRNLPRPADRAHVPAPPRPAVPRPPVPQLAPDAFGASAPANLPRNITPPTPASPPPLQERKPAAERRFTSSDRARVLREGLGRPTVPVLAARASHVDRHSLSRRNVSADLRRAVVLMAILGRCKALDV
jgi:hypothetical protein